MDLQSLPDPVRARILDWAARALGQLTPVEVPPTLARIARFTPAKRARVGGAALAAGLERDAGFRSAVEHYVTSTLDEPAPETEPVGAAARAYLLRTPDANDLVELARTVLDGAEQADRLRDQVVRLGRRLEAATIELAALRERPTAPSDRDAEEIAKLRNRLREQGRRVRTAEDAAAAARTSRQQEIDRLSARVSEVTAEMSAWQQRALEAAGRADRLQQTVSALRDAAGGSRRTADRRLELLLTTVEAAASGLRREWELQGGGLDPADVLAAELRGDGAQGETTADPARLQSWLTLPGAHLVVDGYNVSKSGFAELTLAQQRDRLIRSLSALAARTSADVTVVFDGAAVAVPQPPGRGVRVLFSPPGVIADDVIVDLAAAEPAGRVVVVVSSDRDVVGRVRRHGARAAGSAVLLAMLSP